MHVRAVLFVLVSVVASSVGSAQARQRAHPHVDWRIERAAAVASGATVVLWAHEGHRAVDVAADLGFENIRGLDDWAAGDADPAAVRRLVADPRVRFARPPFRALPASNGIPLTGAPAQHALGNHGAGAKICVIDPEFGQFSNAIAAGYIPASVTPMTFGSGSFDVGGNHGTSCLKIVHEMAPQAQLYAALVYYDIDVLLAANWAVAQGCHVTSGSFVMTLGNYWGPAGDVAQSGVAALVGAGVLPVFAAGNQADRHQDGTFSDANADGYMDWGVHGDSLPLNVGGWSYFTLTWNAWPATAIDYDLEVIDGGGAVVFASTNVQSGSQQPYEEVVWSGGALSNHRLRVKLINLPPGAAQPQLNVHLWGGASFPSSAAKRAGSIAIPAAIPETLSVGALHVSSWPSGASAPYSSWGPCFEDPSLAKPDITAPSAVVDPYYGVFAGTSAACPHAAGAAALFLGLEPGLAHVPGALKSFMLAHADPSGLATVNQPFEYGLGRLAVPATALTGYVGRCTLTPTTPAPGEAFTIVLSGGAVNSPVTLMVDPIAAPPLPFGSAAVHVGSPFAFPLFDGLGIFGVGGAPLLDGSGAYTLPVVRPAVPLALWGVRLQAGFLSGGSFFVTTPALLDA